MHARLTFALALTLSVLAPGCVGMVRVRGVIRDRDTAGSIPGAEVQIGSWSRTADHRGIFDVLVPASEEPYSVYAKANGYSGYTDFRTFDQPGRNGAPKTMNLELTALGAGTGYGDRNHINVVTAPSVRSEVRSEPPPPPRPEPRAQPAPPHRPEPRAQPAPPRREASAGRAICWGCDGSYRLGTRYCPECGTPAGGPPANGR